VISWVKKREPERPLGSAHIAAVLRGDIKPFQPSGEERRKKKLQDQVGNFRVDHFAGRITIHGYLFVLLFNIKKISSCCLAPRCPIPGKGKTSWEGDDDGFLWGA
jgi:hypothetical protein